MCGLTEELLMTRTTAYKRQLNSYVYKLALSTKPTLVKTVVIHSLTQPSSLAPLGKYVWTFRLKSYPLCHVNKLESVWQAQPLQPQQHPPLIPLNLALTWGSDGSICQAETGGNDPWNSLDLTPPVWKNKSDIHVPGSQEVTWISVCFLLEITEKMFIFKSHSSRLYC